MASEADLELWDIDIDQSSVPGHLEAWTLAGYTWDPVGLVATRKSELVETRRAPTRVDTGDNDSGGSTHPVEEHPGMEVEPQEEGLGLGGGGGDDHHPVVLDPESLASAPIYQPQLPGCKLMICQVAGCGVSLEGMKGYFLRHRVCEEHSKAPLLIIGDTPSRLCQQCSKFHHVSAFEGSKRTCRVQLDRIRINKRIRRSRKMNAAAAAALAAAGFTHDGGDGETGLLGEMPSRPAPAFGSSGGGRAKRPADSSGSGEGSWVYSRKSSRHGGAGTREGCAVAAMAAAAVTAAAAAAAFAGSMPSELEPLPESGASDTGSREHPRASLGLSGSARWTTQCSLPPRSPASAAAGAAGFGDGGGGASLAHSPGSAITGASQDLTAAAAAALENGSSGGGVGGLILGPSRGVLQHLQAQQQQQHRVARLDSLPVSAAGDLEISAARIATAAAAGGLRNEGGLGSSLQSQQQLTPAGSLATLAAQQLHRWDAATAPVGQGQFLVAAAAAQGAAVMQQQQLSAAAGSGPKQKSSGHESGSGGSNGAAAAAAAAPEITSLWSTAVALGDITGAAAAAADAAHGAQRRPSQPPVGGGGASLDVAAPLSARGLHPLLQQQLQQELLLQHQHKQLQKLQQQQVLGPGHPPHQPLPQQSQQSLVAQLLGQQHQSQNTSLWEGTALLEGAAKVPPGVQVAAADAAGPAAGGSGAGAVAQPEQARPPQAVAGSQLSAPAVLTGCSPLDSSMQRSGSHIGGGGGADGDAGRGAGGNPSGGTNVLSSSKLVRMSLENDEALDDSSALLGNLIDLLQTQAADPRDGATIAPRVAVWGTANANRLTALSTLSEPGSHGSGNGSVVLAAAAAAATNGFGGFADTASGLAGGGSSLAAARGVAELSDAAAMSRAGSDVVGSPQNAALLAAGLAGGGVSGVLSGAAAGGRSAVGLLASSLGQAAGAVPALVPGSIAGAAAGGGARLLDGLSSAGLTQLQEQALLRASATNHQELLLQQQLLLAQQQHLQLLQQQQQQQQLMRLQQAQAQLPGAGGAFLGGNGSVAAAAPSVPAAGLLLSRLLDADTKTHHLSFELNGCLAEKQLLRRQLLATLSTGQLTGQLPDAEQLAAAAMAATSATGVGGSAAAAAAGALPAALQPNTLSGVLTGLGAQLPGSLNRQLLGGLGAAAATGGLGAAGGLGLGVAVGGLAAAGGGGLSSFPGLLTAAGLGASGFDAAAAAGGLGLGLGAADLRPVGELGAGLSAAEALRLASQHSQHQHHRMLQVGGGSGVINGGGGLGAATSGLLGSGRPSAAAQLQMLAEARAAAAAADGGSAATPGGAASAPSGYACPDLVTRVSLKIMNCLPDELPADIRGRMQAFASQAPLDLVQGCLRPGCTELVLDALHGVDEQRLVSELLRSGDCEAAATALLSSLPAALHSKDIYLQVADQALCLRPGAPPRHASWGAVGMRRAGLRVAKPELVAAECCVVHVADTEGCVRVRVYGKHLSDPGVTVLARMAGTALSVTISPALPTTSQALDTTASPAAASLTAAPQPRNAAAATAAVAAASSSSLSASASPSPSPPPTAAAAASLYDAFDVEVQLPYNAPPQGLLILEPRAGVLLGGWAPVLLLEDRGLAVEMEGLMQRLGPDAARRLATRLGVFVDHVERCAARAEAREAGRRRRSGAEVDGAAEGDPEEVEAEADGGGGAEGEERLGGRDDGATFPAGRPLDEVFGCAHRRVIRMGRALLSYAALRSCPRLMSYIGAELVDMGEPLAALPTAAYPLHGYPHPGDPHSGGTSIPAPTPLLACALLSGCVPSVAIASAWVARCGAALDWRAPVPGQPPGATLLHLAASLPPHTAVHALDLLWALATSPSQPPAAADAFAAAWFAEDDGAGGGGDFDSPSRLFRASVDAAASTAAAVGGSAAAGACLALEAADSLDRLCLFRLASAYIAAHNVTSPLDHVELPSLEANSCAAVAAAALSAANSGNTANSGDGIEEEVQGLNPGGAAVAVLRSGCERRDGGQGASIIAGSGGGRDCGGYDGEGDRSGHGSVGSPPSAVGSLATATSSAGWAAALAAAAAVVASPPRMRVSVAPKALAQTAAVAASRHRSAATGGGAGGRTSDGGALSWLAGGGSGADASCVPPSGTTAATTALFASGSMPAFASGMSQYGIMAPYGSSVASYYNAPAHAAGGGAAAASGKPLSLDPLVAMFGPLPESPSSGLQDNGSASGALLQSSAQRTQSGYGGEAAAAAAWVVEPIAAAGGTGAAGEVEAAAGYWLRGGEADGLGGRPKARVSGGRLAAAQAVAAAMEAEADRRGDGNHHAGNEAPTSLAAADSAADLAGPEPRRGHMRGLTRMFKRLFKKGSAEAVGPVD